MENRQKLLDIIGSNDLEREDKERWFDFFQSSQDSVLDIYLEILSEYPKEIHWFNEILKRKVAAMKLIKNGDDFGQREMKEIIDEEMIKLNELSSKM